MIGKDDSAQMMLLAAFITVLGMITYSLLLNDVIFSRHFTSVETDVGGRDLREFRSLTFEQVKAAAAAARSQNASFNTDMTETFTSFMDDYIQAAIGIFSIKATSLNITLNSVNITHNTTSPSYPQYAHATIVSHTYTNGSLIIPMDNQQNNILTVYRLIYDITDNYGVPVWEILEDPRGSSYDNWSVNITTTDEPFTDNPSPSSIQERSYAGGPFVIDASDLNETIINRIQGLANNTINTVYVANRSTAEFEFDTMTSKNFTITFTLGDGTNATLNLTFPGPSATLLTYGGDADNLHVEASGAAVENNKLKYITLVNSGTSDIVIDKIRVNWTPDDGEQITKVKLNKTEVWSGLESSGTTTDITNYTLHVSDINAGKVTIHRLWESFTYENNTMLRRPPKIAIYPPEGVHDSDLHVMTGYYADTGVPYTIIDDDVINASNSLTGEGLYAYDVLTIPHANLDGSDPMPFYTAYKLNEWVDNGGLVHAQCRSIDETGDGNGPESLERAIERADGDTHPQYGFLGVEKDNSLADGADFIFTESSAYNPLTQAYTEDGTLPVLGGTVKAFAPVSHYNASINESQDMVILANTTHTPPGIEYAYTPYGRGLVIYLAGHDQSGNIQRERLMYSVMFYSVVEEQTVPLVKDVDVTLTFESGDTSYEGRFGI
jgi:hypothetical protein